MKRFRAVLAAALLAGATSVASLGLTQPASAEPVICETFGSTSIQNGRYIVQNNVWGASTPQCIDVNQNGGFTITQAGHNNPTNGAPAAYPSIFAGCHWTNCSADSNMPIQVSQISSANTSVSVTYPGSGTWNAAYDIWLDPTPRTDGQNGAELMIWLNRQGSIQPIGSPVGNATIAGRSYEVWYGNPGWHVVSYLSTSATNSLSFDAMAFINDMISRGYINNSWYLTSIQAGFEPWVGGAGLAVNSFSASVNGGGNNQSPPPPPPPGGCTATATVQSQWEQGYVMQVTVANTSSSPINGWTVTTTLPSGHQLVNPWNATVTPSGQTLTAVPLSWNANLAPGQQVEWGFQASRPGGSSVPTTFNCAAG
ncbi:MAG TPA: cellulose binding domain-containing protein [Natronosporangium sp.]